VLFLAKPKFAEHETDDLRIRIAQAIEALHVPSPEFSINIGWAQSYEELFAGHLESESGILHLSKTAMEKGFVLFAGKGGGAKTVIVLRLARHALKSQVLPIVISLKDWTGKDYGSWEAAESQPAKVDLLLDRFGLVSCRSLDLEGIPARITRLILVDGLNEVNSRVGQEIIYALEDYVRLAPNSRIIVTDRLVRRGFVSRKRWHLSIVCPLQLSEVEKQVAKKFGTAAARRLSQESYSLLASPYFLDAYLREGGIATTRSEEFEIYFRKHVALTTEEIDLTAAAAFDAYKTASRTFPLVDFIARTSDRTVQKLKSSGALVTEREVAYFDHHLKHDYLVSRYLSRRPDQWNDATFKIVTFGASSFETITLALEQIAGVEDADRFLRQVYDWNPYGAGYAIAEAGQTAVSLEIRIVIFAMLAERRLDIMLRTAERAIDALSLIQGEDVEPFKTAQTLEEIFVAVNGVESEKEWFHEWRGLYTTPLGTPATRFDVGRLTEKDSVIGWTSANVLKRLQLDEAQQTAVRQVLRQNEDAVMRWRAAHVLGAFPSEANLNALVAALHDRAPSVRFGAVRSVIEIAARNHGLTEAGFQRLAEDADRIAEHRSVADEVQRAVFVRSAIVPANWTSMVLSLISVLQTSKISALMSEQWDRVAKDVIVAYGK
jgi:hypothetical protein